MKMSLIDVGGQKQQEKGNSEMAYWLILVQESTSQSNHLSPGPTFPCPKAPPAKRDKRLYGLVVKSVYSCLTPRAN